MHQKRLAAGLCSNPLGELTALSDPLAGFTGKDNGRGKRHEGKGKKGRNGGGREDGEERGQGWRRGRQEKSRPTVISKSRRDSTPMYPADHQSS